MNDLLCRASAFVVQFEPPQTRRLYHVPFGDLILDQAKIDEGLTLTAIGMGTAFALLLILSAAIWLSGKFFAPEKVPSDQAAEVSTEGRDKALAAAIAVSALLEIRDNSAALPTAGG